MKENYQKLALENLASHRIHGVLPKKYHMRYRSGQEPLVEESSLREIEQMIQDCGRDMDVPEGLLPENMGRKLEFLQKKKKRRRRILLAAAAVAALLVCVVVLLAL